MGWNYGLVSMQCRPSVVLSRCWQVEAAYAQMVRMMVVWLKIAVGIRVLLSFSLYIAVPCWYCDAQLWCLDPCL